MPLTRALTSARELPEMGEYLFVYGTLRPAFAPARMKPLTERFELIGKATATGKLYDLGDYPGATLEQDGLIVGEVVELPEDGAVLAALDFYEGYDPLDEAQSLFVRQRYTAKLVDGRTVECWIYVYQQDLQGAEWIPSGDYSAIYNFKVEIREEKWKLLQHNLKKRHTQPS